MNIDGSIALITGASKRIGRAIALALAAKGCNIAVHYHRSEHEALQTRDAVLSFGVKCAVVRANLAVVDECAGLWSEIAAELKATPDIIVNNASRFRRGTLNETTAEDFDQTLAVNVRAPMLLAQMMARDLSDGKIGKIVNINDRRRVYKSRFDYGVSNASLSGLTQSLAVSLAPRIQVNEVRLGPVLPLRDSDAPILEPSNRTLGPAGRVGRVDEVSLAVIGLIDNDYINGTSLIVDGGLNLLEHS